MKRMRYRGQVIELHRVPGSKRACEGVIYWDHDRGPMPVSPGRNYRQTRRQARELVDLVLDGISLMNNIPMMLAEMGRDVEIKELEDGTLQWELDLQNGGGS